MFRWHGFRVALRLDAPAGRWRQLLARLRGRRPASPAVRAAGLIFRLRRFGVATPQLLAFGRQPDGAGFLLTRPAPDTMPLVAWLATPNLRRASVLRRTGRLLCRLHDAGCRLAGRADLVHVRPDGAGLRIADVTGVEVRTPRTDAARAADLRRLLAALRLHDRPADAARVVRGYRGGRRPRQAVPA
jgi:hypothetical protein